MVLVNKFNIIVFFIMILSIFMVSAELVNEDNTFYYPNSNLTFANNFDILCHSFYDYINEYEIWYSVNGGETLLYAENTNGMFEFPGSIYVDNTNITFICRVLFSNGTDEDFVDFNMGTVLIDTDVFYYDLKQSFYYPYYYDGTLLDAVIQVGVEDYSNVKVDQVIVDCFNDGFIDYSYLSLNQSTYYNIFTCPVSVFGSSLSTYVILKRLSLSDEFPIYSCTQADSLYCTVKRSLYYDVI